MASAWQVRGRIVEDKFGIRLAEASEGNPVELAVAGGIAATWLIALQHPREPPRRGGVFEIDRVIRRTVASAALTVLLVAAYIGLIIVLQPLLGPFTSGSDLAVAASTLAVAALFGPLRGRIQRVVDGRFDRAHYDAVRTIEVFSQRLRDEVDVHALVADLAAVATTTVRPRSVTVWLGSSSIGGSAT